MDKRMVGVARILPLCALLLRNRTVRPLIAFAIGVILSVGIPPPAAFAAIPIAQPGTEGFEVIVNSTNPVIATYQGNNSALYSNDLYLVVDGTPANDRFLFNNHESRVGSTVTLGSFPIGTRLIFRLHVRNTGKDYFTGPASRNPDNQPHARAQADWKPNETLVSFEDGVDVAYNDLSFSFIPTTAESAMYFTIRPNTIYAGWSARPSSGPVTVVEGQWPVPAVDCQAPIYSRPWWQSRAAPWVGIWGKTVDPETTWLAQIGTASVCATGGQSKALPQFDAFRYKAVWELHHLSDSGGYNDPGPTELFDVQPGDIVHARVSYNGRRPDNRLLFEAVISVTDKNNRPRDSRTITFETDPGVSVNDAAWQGGCIVESQPDGYARPSPLYYPYDVPVGGLARFTPPIQFSRCTVNGKDLANYSGYETLFRWDMTWTKELDSKLALAGTSLPGKNGGFSVTWQRWHSPVPEILSFDTFRQGQLVYFRVGFTDSDGDAAGFGFVGVNGSGWALETHPFSSPSYGIVTYTAGEGTGSVAYPFNHLCGTPSQYESDVAVAIYDRAGLLSSYVTVHLACSAPIAR